MAVLPATGQSLGPYDILTLIGSGGMGVVYKARDTRLDREVAIKVLLPEVALNEEALARFEREAKAVAALSHPNILAIHDLQRDGVTAYAVMEFLDGGTLRSALEAGPMALRRAVRIAVQVAGGLAAAHDRQIVHRDLKPENIGLTRDGQVKILDFGLAREPGGASRWSVDSPTANYLTNPGLVLGTVNYMSPEQVRGEIVDHRSDLFSFGVVLSEMLTGQRAFERATAAETMTAILNEDPPAISDVGVKVPTAVDRVIRRCLEKHPEDRFHSAQDMAFALENALTPGQTDEVVPAQRRRRSFLPALLVAGGMAAGAGLAVTLWPQGAAQPVRVRQLTLSGFDSAPSASRDGRFVAFTSNRGGVPRVWVKQVETRGEQALATGHWPRFFPDQSLLFLHGGEDGRDSAWRIPILGGNPPQLGPSDVVEVDPSPDGGRIAFIRFATGGDGSRAATLGVASAAGDMERVLLSGTNVEFARVRWSPDGQRLAAIRRPTIGIGTTTIVIVDATSGDVRELPAGAERACHQTSTPQFGGTAAQEGTTGAYGALAWNGDGRSLIVTRSDSAQVYVPGEPGCVMRIDVDTGRPHTLYYAPDLFGLFGSTNANAGIEVLGPGRVVFDRVEIRQTLSEVRIGTGATDAARFETRGNGLDRQPAYSHDGRFVIFTSNRSGNLDLWTVVTATGELKQLTNDPAQDWDPAFTPDGKHVLWSSNRKTGHLEIWMADFDPTTAAMTGARQVSQDGVDAENPTMASGTGWIVYTSNDPAKAGIWRVKSDGTGAQALVSGAFNIPDVSPDGRYALYLSNDRVRLRRTILAIELATARRVDFQIVVPYQLVEAGAGVTWGRARWADNGRSIVFVAQDETGRSRLFSQVFGPGQDTSTTRRVIADSPSGASIESFGISTDGKWVTVSNGYYSRSLMLADGVPGVTAALSAPR